MRRGTLAVIAIAGLLAACGSDDDGSSASSTTTTTAATTSTSVPVDRATAVWPTEASNERPTEPVTAARTFATDVLHLVDPVVGEYQAGDARSGEVEIRPTADGPVTTVFVRQLSGEETWSVLGTATADIEIDVPSAGQAVSDPVVVRGRARAFEGVVNVAILADGVAEPIGTGAVMGGGDELRPFEGAIDRNETDVARGALVLFTRSAKDGAVWSASVLRIAFAGEELAVCQSPLVPDVGAGEMLVTVFYTCRDTDELVAVQRAVPASDDMLRVAIDALVAGPGDTGLISWFSEETASIVQSATVDAAGRAVVDFVDLRPIIPNASASAGSTLLLDQLDATVFAIPSIRTVEYRMQGSCQDFGEFVQLGCTVRSRP